MFIEWFAFFGLNSAHDYRLTRLQFRYFWKKTNFEQPKISIVSMEIILQFLSFTNFFKKFLVKLSAFRLVLETEQKKKFKMEEI